MVWWIIGGVPALFVIAVLIGLLITQKRYYGKDNAADFDFFSFEDKFDESRAPTLIVKIFDKKYRFLLDTGANKNMLQKDFLKEMLKYSPKHPIQQRDDLVTRDASGKQRNTYSTELVFKLRNMEFREEFMINEMKGVQDFSNENNLNIVGILGTDFFDKYQWKIDFGKYIVWHKRNEVCSKQK